VSALVDAQRKEDTRAAAAQRANTLLMKLTRMVKLFEDGKTDAEIGRALEWSSRTVRFYRQFLKMRLGIDSGGRWRDKL
jgi:DNA-binding NarL/FixJ family response regulator